MELLDLIPLKKQEAFLGQRWKKHHNYLPIDKHGIVITLSHFYKTELDLDNYIYYPLPNRL